MRRARSRCSSRLARRRRRVGGGRASRAGRPPRGGAPAPAPAPRGGVLRITGVTAHAWGAPRLRASAAVDAHASLPVSAAARSSALGAGDEWELVRLTGTVTKVERLGDRWRAELKLTGGGSVTVPVL